MFKHTLVALATGLTCLGASAQSASEINTLRQQIDELRQQYEARIKALEDRLEAASRQGSTAATVRATTESPVQPATEAPAAAVAQVPKNTDNRFNPSMSVILSGTYASLKRDPDTWELSGFKLGGEGHGVGPGTRSFNLGESEISFRANIDTLAMGALTLGLNDENEAEVEEAYIQSTSLPHGITLKGGRFFGAIGYQNEQHAHAWDFVDAPFVHQAFLGGQYKQDGAQIKWVLPTTQYMELGAELGNGKAYPGSERNSNQLGATTLFARTGGDIGDSHSWRLGLSWLRAKAADREWGLGHAHEGDEHAGEEMSFTGKSRLWVLDGVWKWAPNGNASSTAFKLQGEYFRRKESGTAEIVDEGSGFYRSSQSGWYLQGVYQFMPKWRVGLRHDRLDSGSVRVADAIEELAGEKHNPKRTSLMLDWSPSEFHRWRVQLNDDRARLGVKDTQIFLQYQMSLGAHGAHAF